MKAGFIVSAIFAAIMISAPALCQPPPGPPPAHDPETQSKKEEYRKKIEERVTLMILWDMADEMNLPAEKEGEFLGILRKHMQQSKQLAEKELHIMNELRLNREKGDKAIIKEGLDKLRENRKRRHEVEDNLQKNLEEVLTPEQQARFIDAWPRTRENVRRYLTELKQRRKEGKNKSPMGKGPKNKGPKDNIKQ